MVSTISEKLPYNALNLYHLLYFLMISQAVQLLKKGHLVAFPTDTVYGLGALANHALAINKLFEIKQRPLDKPCSLLLPDPSHLSDWVDHVKPEVLCLMQAFWPGPLTILLPAGNKALETPCSALGRIGLRIPAHPVALQLLRQLNEALVVSSANVSGQFSLTTQSAVQAELGSAISLILKGEHALGGMESTVLDMTKIVPVIRRVGAISAKQIEQVLHQSVQIETAYAVKHQHIGCGIQWIEDEKELDRWHLNGKKTAFLHYTSRSLQLLPGTKCIAMPNHPIEYQQMIYHILHQLKQEAYELILIQSVPKEESWEAINACINQWCVNPI